MSGPIPEEKKLEEREKIRKESEIASPFRREKSEKDAVSHHQQMEKVDRKD